MNLTPQEITTLINPKSKRTKLITLFKKECPTKPIPLPEHILVVLEGDKNDEFTAGKLSLINCFNNEFIWDMRKENIKVVGYPKIDKKKKGKTSIVRIDKEFGDITEAIIRAAKNHFEVILFHDRAPILLDKKPSKIKIRKEPITVDIHYLANVVKNIVISEYPSWERPSEKKQKKGYKIIKGEVHILLKINEPKKIESVNIKKLPQLMKTYLETFPLIVYFGSSKAIIKINPENLDITYPIKLKENEGKAIFGEAQRDLYHCKILKTKAWEEVKGSEIITYTDEEFIKKNDLEDKYRKD